ncbi:MAG: hypothetical protein GY822_04195 [Deltaproteobacteria bacterium]|nr:hypothetical protein [Deltaproteobacteria bacterium]
MISRTYAPVLTPILTFSCGLLLAGDVLAKSVELEYGSGPLKVKQVAKYDDKRLDKEIKKYLKFLKVKTVERRSEGKLEPMWTTAGELKNATREEKVILMSGLMVKKSKGREIDLLIPSKAGKVPASFFWDTADHIVVESGAPIEWKGAAPTVASLQKSYKLGEFKEEGAAWDEKALRSVGLALQLLSKEERSMIEGIPFVRMPRGHGVHRAIYSRDTKRAQVEIYNHTFQFDDEVLIGSVTSPYPDSVGVLLHELGHAIADRRHRELIPQSAALNAEYKRCKKRSTPRLRKQTPSSTSSMQQKVTSRRKSARNSRPAKKP